MYRKQRNKFLLVLQNPDQSFLAIWDYTVSRSNSFWAKRANVIFRGIIST